MSAPKYRVTLERPDGTEVSLVGNSQVKNALYRNYQALGFVAAAWDLIETRS